MPSAKKLKTSTPVPIEPIIPPATVESDASDSSSNESSSSSDEEDVLLKDLIDFGAKSRLRIGARFLGSLRYVHARLKTVHAGHETDELRLACGRPIHGGFKLLEDVDESFPYPRCLICFGRP